MIMPFYFPSGQAPKVVIVGGGYAGLAALITLREKQPEAEIILIDPRDHHLKVTHLHESFRTPMASMRVPFSILENRFNIRTVRASVEQDDRLFTEWAEKGEIAVNGEAITFDYLIWSAGAGGCRTDKNTHCLDLDDFSATAGPDLLQSHLKTTTEGRPVISVVGSGATGIQFIFEMAAYIRLNQLPWSLRLVDAGAAPLQQFNPRLGQYVLSRLQDSGIEYLNHQYFRDQSEGQIVLESSTGSDITCLPSALSLLFTGKREDQRIRTNRFGQVMIDGKVLPTIFAAGDGTQYPAPGSNAHSAQTALRKGRLVARNILRKTSQVRIMEPFLHRDFGYVIGMGPSDAIGWVALQGNIIAGQPALLLKEVVEAQYELLLSGLDTYIL